MTTADPRRFLYRSLDPDGAMRLATKHLSGCDDAIFLSDSSYRTSLLILCTPR